MSCQISAIFSNASSRPRFFCTLRFTFGSFGARGRAPLGAFDAADEAGTAERDLRFPIISATLRVALEIFGPLATIIPGAAILPACPGAISGQMAPPTAAIEGACPNL